MLFPKSFDASQALNRNTGIWIEPPSKHSNSMNIAKRTDPTITPHWWANIMSNARVFASASLHRLHKPCQFKRRENELYVKSPLYPATFSPVGSPLRKSFSSHWTPTSFHQADEPWAGRLHSKRSTKLAEISVQCVIDQVRLRTKVEEEEAE